jgi:hypothetical protein
MGMDINPAAAVIPKDTSQLEPTKTLPMSDRRVGQSGQSCPESRRGEHLVAGSRKWRQLTAVGAQSDDRADEE